MDAKPTRTLPELANQIHETAPYLDHTQDPDKPFRIMGKGLLVESLEDGVASHANREMLVNKVDYAKRCAKAALGHTEADIRTRMGNDLYEGELCQRRGSEWATNAYVWHMISGEGLERRQELAAGIPAPKIQAEFARFKEKAEWYDRGAALAQETLTAVDRALANQPRSVTRAETRHDRSKLRRARGTTGFKM